MMLPGSQISKSKHAKQKTSNKLQEIDNIKEHIKHKEAK